MTTKTQEKQEDAQEKQRKILERELEARILMLENILRINGYEVTREGDKLLIKHPNGFQKTVPFSKTRMAETFVKGGSDTFDRMIASNDHSPDKIKISKEELDRIYMAGGTHTLQQERSGFVQAYYRALDNKCYQKQREEKDRERDQRLKATVSKSSKEEPSMEL